MQWMMFEFEVLDSNLTSWTSPSGLNKSPSLNFVPNKVVPNHMRVFDNYRPTSGQEAYDVSQVHIREQALAEHVKEGKYAERKYY